MGSGQPPGPKGGVVVPKDDLQKWYDEAEKAGLKNLAAWIEKFIKMADY